MMCDEAKGCYVSREFSWSMSNFKLGESSAQHPPMNGIVGTAVAESPAFVRDEKKRTVRCKTSPLHQKGGKNMAANEKIRVRLKSYDHTLIDAAAAKIVEVAKRNGSAVSGPIPLPTEREIVTILRAVHKYKDSREQFEMRTHKRLIDILNPQAKTVEALMNIELPAGVEIEIVKA